MRIRIAKRNKFTSRNTKGNWAIIEAEGCIINIKEELCDRQGRKITSISITPDGERYIGERIWRLRGTPNNRVVQLKKRARSKF